MYIAIQFDIAIGNHKHLKHVSASNRNDYIILPHENKINLENYIFTGWSNVSE